MGACKHQAERHLQRRGGLKHHPVWARSFLLLSRILLQAACVILSVDETVRNPKSEDPQVSNLFLPALAREWELKTVLALSVRSNRLCGDQERCAGEE